MIDGKTVMVTNEYDVATHYYKFIEIESLIHDCALGKLNAFFVNFFSCPRPKFIEGTVGVQ